MSNIYIQEPPTHGKVLLKTTVGDIDIELWYKEASKACRNFVQLSMEGYYNGTIFHRIVKGFIAQGGDPTGTGEGGESIYGKPFKDEFHTRLRFVRRGLVAMANAGKDDNGSQFFFTLAPCPELQSKHTIFGKVTGNTLYNMLKLENCEIGADDRPVYPPKILSTEVLLNPFEDIIPRQRVKDTTQLKDKIERSKMVATKNFNLLSFGDEAEDDEDEIDSVNIRFTGKSKSSHDLSNDPKLSSVPAVDVIVQPSTTKDKNIVKEDEHVEGDNNDSGDAHVNKSDEGVSKVDLLHSVKEKLKSTGKPLAKRRKVSVKEAEGSDSDGEYYLGKDRAEEQKKKMKEIKEEFHNLKKDMKKTKEDNTKESDSGSDESENEDLVDFKNELKKYKEIKKTQKPKGSSREQETMALLSRFRSKLETAKESATDAEEQVEEDDDKGWMNHVLNFEESSTVLAKDANTKTDDWFDIYDPRNAINKRRRGIDTSDTKESQRRKRY